MFFSIFLISLFLFYKQNFFVVEIKVKQKNIYLKHNLILKKFLDTEVTVTSLNSQKDKKNRKTGSAKCSNQKF